MGQTGTNSDFVLPYYLYIVNYMHFELYAYLKYIFYMKYEYVCRTNFDFVPLVPDFVQPILCILSSYIFYDKNRGMNDLRDIIFSLKDKTYVQPGK
jgi:hypothetical protein